MALNQPDEQLDPLLSLTNNVGAKLYKCWTNLLILWCFDTCRTVFASLWCQKYSRLQVWENSTAQSYTSSVWEWKSQKVSKTCECEVPSIYMAKLWSVFLWVQLISKLFEFFVKYREPFPSNLPATTLFSYMWSVFALTFLPENRFSRFLKTFLRIHSHRSCMKWHMYRFQK